MSQAAKRTRRTAAQRQQELLEQQQQQQQQQPEMEQDVMQSQASNGDDVGMVEMHNASNDDNVERFNSNSIHGNNNNNQYDDDDDDDGEEQATRLVPPTPSFATRNERDHIKIMLATDNHVGYMERDPVRGQDSIQTLEEILQLSVEHDVDLILLGGDLFHENKPSHATLHQVMALLRQYTLGERPIQVELLSDPHDGSLAGYDFPAVNYEDPNLNVSIPVFSIHGNHDDPQGTGETGALSALDLLSVSGLVNYFGRIELPSDDIAASTPSTRAAQGGGFAEKGIRIKPVLLQKGNTKLALYGMGNIKDERMHFELRSNRVRMYRPQEHSDDWFNILVVHQNRVAHNPKACVPETMFDDSVHLVVWGHEHEQKIQPQPVSEKRYHISQPGSSIATSLCPAEAVEKCVAILHVDKTDFLIEPIPLKTVRPFVMGDMVLADELEANGLEPKREDIMKLLRNRINQLIQQAKTEYAETYPDREMPLPLVRLRVEYTNQEISNPQRFGQEFTGKVANPRDVLQFTKKKAAARSRNNDTASEFVDLEEAGLLPSEKLDRVDVGMLVQEYLQAQNLDILNPEGLEGAVLNFVEKDDKDAIDSFVTKMLKHTVKGLITIDPEEDQIEGQLERLRQEQQRRDKEVEKIQMGQHVSRGTSSKERPTSRTASDDSMLEGLEDDDDDDDDEEFGFDKPQRVVNKGKGKTQTTTRKTGPGSLTTKKTTATATSSKARSTVKKTFLGGSEEEDDDFEQLQEQGNESDVVIDELISTPASSRHAAALGLFSSGKPTVVKKTKTAAVKGKPRAATSSRKKQVEEEEEEVDNLEPIDQDDDDDFVEPSKPKRATAARISRRR